MKTKKRSKILSLLLALSMLVGMVPFSVIPASAADDISYTQAEIRGYKSFESYLRSSDSRDLKLMEDIDYTVGIKDVPINVIRNQKLDLNGHKITIDASRRTGFVHLLSIRRGEFTLYDSKGGGELAVSFPNDDKAYSIIMMSSEKKDEPSKFTMNGGTLTKLHPNMTYTYGASGCIGDDYFNKPENGKRSQITINGGTINCPYDWDRSQSLLDLPVEAMPLALQLLYSNLTINGGTFNGIVWTDTLWRGEQDTEPRVVLNGGEFNSPFVVEGMQKDATQIVIDGAHFKDGFHVNNGYSMVTWDSERMIKELPPSEYDRQMLDCADYTIERLLWQGDSRIMGAFGYRAEGGLIRRQKAPICDYLDLEYYRGSLDQSHKILQPVSSYLKRSCGIEFLLNAYCLLRQSTLPEQAE